MTVGGVDTRLVAAGSQVEYVPDSGHGFHSVHVAALSVGSGGQISGVGSADIPVESNAILDTGTNVLLLPSHLISALQSQICERGSLPSCTDLFSNRCVALEESQVDSYPALNLHLTNNVTLHMSARDYLLKGSPQAKVAGQYCLGIRDGGSAGGSGFIIGDTTMRNYVLVFDLAEKKIGWGPVNAETCGSL